MNSYTQLHLLQQNNEKPDDFNKRIRDLETKIDKLETKFDKSFPQHNTIPADPDESSYYDSEGNLRPHKSC